MLDIFINLCYNGGMSIRNNAVAWVFVGLCLQNGAGPHGEVFAEEAIDGILASPQFTEDATGIIKDDMGLRPSVLVLSTTHGQFLATISLTDVSDLNRRDFYYEDVILLTIAITLAQMSKEDTVLQESVEQVKQVYRVMYESVEQGGRNYWAVSVNKKWHIKDCWRWVQALEQLFASGKQPCIALWRDWHEPLNQGGLLKLFFE